MRHDRLPAAFVHIQPVVLGARGGWDEVLRIPDSPWSPPHKVGVRGFVDDAVDVSALVRENYDSEQFVLQNYRQ